MLSFWRTISLVCVFCAAAAIVSAAQDKPVFTTLFSFDGTNGAYPTELVQATDGNLYGTTGSGGAYGSGTVFKITPGGTLTTIYSFCARTYCPDGQNPNGLVQAADGNFYSTTVSGGANGYGTVFKMTAGGALTTLHSFDGNDGAYPTAPLIEATDHNLYGTTTGDGSITDGTVFKITPGGTLTTLSSFPVCYQYSCPYPAFPFAAGLVQASDGNFYGTSEEGGTSSACGSFPSYGCGTVFKITPTGKLTTLHSFDFTDGYSPQAGLVQATDGNLYGTTEGGGANTPPACHGGATTQVGCGTVFKITPTGTLTTLHSFDSTDGQWPVQGLIQATDGNFYGRASVGGAYGWGTVFKMTPEGTLTTLHSFDSTDGAEPYAALIQDTDGNFYGTTAYGGANGDGTVFSLGMGLGPFVETRPTMGRVGEPVIILGTALKDVSSVTFNATPAALVKVTQTAIQTTVPSGATTGLVEVVTPGGTLRSNVPFRVVQ